MHKYLPYKTSAHAKFQTFSNWKVSDKNNWYLGNKNILITWIKILI